MDKIKIYIGMDECNKVHFFKKFEIVEKLPQIGSIYGSQYEVIAINELTKDYEQGDPEAWDYNIYKIVAEDITERGDNNYYDYRYVALKED